MFGCVILSHNGGNTLPSLIHQIDDAGGRAVIHVDSKAPSLIREMAKSATAHYDTCSLLPETNATWGGFSLVAASLSGFEYLASTCEWLVLLSDTHFPIKPLSHFAEFLRASSTDAYILHREIDLGLTGVHGGSRYKYAFHERPNLGITRGAPRPPRYAKIYAGSQWIAIRRSVLITMMERLQEEIDWFRESFVPDEAFFPSVMKALLPNAVVDNKSFTYLRWEGHGPAILESIGSLQVNEHHFFGRKFLSLPSDYVQSDKEAAVLSDALDATKRIEEDSTQVDYLGPFATVMVEELTSTTRVYLGQRYRINPVIDIAYGRFRVEFQVKLRNFSKVFLLFRASGNSASYCIASHQFNCGISPGHPLASPDEHRTTIIRCPSLINNNRPSYVVSHPALTRGGFYDVFEKGTSGVVNAVQGWLDILVAIDDHEG